MSDTPQDHDSRSRWITYTAVALVAVVVLVFMLLSYTGQKETTQATQKAQELSAAITQAGFTSPDVDVIARVLGDDGGAVCANEPGSLTTGALKLQLANGAAGPGMRPVRIDRIVVGGERLIIQTYCPQNLDEFDEFVKTLKFADVVKD